MSDHPVTLEFIAGQLQRVLSDLRILRDDVDVLAAISRRLDSSYDRLVGEMREIRDDPCHACTAAEDRQRRAYA